jgi:hypothetical protein
VDIGNLLHHKEYHEDETGECYCEKMTKLPVKYWVNGRQIVLEKPLNNCTAYFDGCSSFKRKEINNES